MNYSNYSIAVFLINDNVRAIKATYEAHEDAPVEIFKTFDETIAIGDLLLVPTNTRHGYTVVKVKEVDIEVDLNASKEVHWVVSKVSTENYDRTVKEEAVAIKQINEARKQKEREKLREMMFAGSEEAVKALPIASAGTIDKVQTPGT